MKLSYEDIGKRLKEMRLQKGYTQNEVANLAGVSVSYVKNIENGKKPSLNYLLSIVKNFGISFDWIILGVQDTQNWSDSPYFDDETVNILDTLKNILVNPNEAVRIWGRKKIKETFQDYFE
jgi:transcriptional regulator with XRE-family HTH domain